MRIRPRRPAVLVAGTFGTVAAGVIGGTAVRAAADPPGLDPPSCTTTLARVHSWPGEIPTSDGLAPVFSDAFYSSLARTPECSSGPG